MTAGPSFDDHGSGPAVVFLHGVGSGRNGWRNQREPVVAARRRFIAIDAPGFGTNPLPDEPGFAPHVDGVIAVLDALEIDRAVICGHSLGGMTAQEVYAAAPDRVAGLVLSATSPAFGRPDGDFQREFLRSRFEPFDAGMTMPEFAAEFAVGLVGPDPAPGVLDEIVEVMAEVPVETYRRSMHTLTSFDQRANLANIAVPTLLIAGQFDKNSPAPMMTKMATKIAGSELVVMAGTGHMGPIENVAQFNQALLGLLATAVPIGEAT